MEDFGVADSHPQAPASHIIGLGERIQFDGDFLGAWNLQEAGSSIALKTDLQVGRIMQQGQSMSAGKFDSSLKELDVGDRTGRVVGIIEPQYFGPFWDLLGRSLQVWKESVLSQQWEVENLGAGNFCPGGISRVTGIRHQGCIARV